jgi:hypothetical protein
MEVRYIRLDPTAKAWNPIESWISLPWVRYICLGTGAKALKLDRMPDMSNTSDMSVLDRIYST